MKAVPSPPVASLPVLQWVSTVDFLSNIFNPFCPICLQLFISSLCIWIAFSSSESYSWVVLSEFSKTIFNSLSAKKRFTAVGLVFFNLLNALINISLIDSSFTFFIDSASA